MLTYTIPSIPLYQAQHEHATYNFSTNYNIIMIKLRVLRKIVPMSRYTLGIVMVSRLFTHNTFKRKEKQNL